MAAKLRDIAFSVLLVAGCASVLATPSAEARRAKPPTPSGTATTTSSTTPPGTAPPVGYAPAATPEAPLIHVPVVLPGSSAGEPSIGPAPGPGPDFSPAAPPDLTDLVSRPTDSAGSTDRSAARSGPGSDRKDSAGRAGDDRRTRRQVLGDVLSRTGSEPRPLVRVGLAALTLGVGLVVLSRRRRPGVAS